MIREVGAQCRRESSWIVPQIAHVEPCRAFPLSDERNHGKGP
jgi:hypothetical protein